MSPVDKLIYELQQQPNSPTVTNPYLSLDIANNLHVYLNCMLKIEGKRILLVGEAPGYKGCRITGIPFASSGVFEHIDHPLLKKLKSQLRLSIIESENTATIVWEYLSRKNSTPLFWNAFPFHPYPKGNENGNRTPIRKEIETGERYLKLVHALYDPELVGGIGNNGFKCARKAFPDIDVVSIRHPSFGGKSEFIKGMDEIL